MSPVRCTVSRVVIAKGLCMGKRVFNPQKLPHVSRENQGKIFGGLRDAKLGTEKNPVQICVTCSERESELKAVCDERGWVCSITVDPEQPEDISGFERLLNPPLPVVGNSRPGRNAACPCGSGKKYKKCCAS